MKFYPMFTCITLKVSSFGE